MSTCRSCERRPATSPITLTAHCRGRAREWRVQVCTDCWRAFEAVIEVAAIAVQAQLPFVGTASGWWFK